MTEQTVAATYSSASSPAPTSLTSGCAPLHQSEMNGSASMITFTYGASQNVRVIVWRERNTESLEKLRMHY